MIDFSSLLAHHLLDQKFLGITKHLLMMWIASLLTFLLVVLASRGEGLFFKRLRVALEGVISFLWQDIVEPNLGHDGRRFLPYFLTLFFFILMMNLLGLVPFGATATGNISVTAALALLTLILIQASGIKRHGLLGHFGNLVPHGVPLWVAPLIFVIELMGYITKCLALCVRLFANMTFGHLVIIVFLGMILLFGQSSLWQGLLVAPISIGLAVGLYGLELIVGLIQAYVFTFLTAIFVGGALHPEH